MITITTRKADIHDLEFLLRLENESFSAFQRNTGRNIKHGIISDFQEVLIAEVNGDHNEPIGAIVLFKYTKTVRIYSIAVLPSFQNKGIGEQLLREVYTYAVNHSFKKITLEVRAGDARLTAWYKARGFEKVGVLKDFYGKGEDALKMELKTDAPFKTGRTTNLIVINQPFKWKNHDINARIITVKDYISNPDYQNNSDFRVFNLCSSYRYQSYGYYVSLLASARGQRVIPSSTTIRDFRINNLVQSAVYDIDEVIHKTLEKEQNSNFTLYVYFGHSVKKEYKILAAKLYQLFEAPLFRVDFVKHDKWLIRDIRMLTFNKIPDGDMEMMYEFAARYFNKKRYNISKLTNFKYDLAILTNPMEENPPSNAESLQKFKIAANRKGVYVEFISRSDFDKINEFDALFIRETTNVNHHTYDFSRTAYAEGLVVVDDPWSILRCSNKIYQNELFRKHRILTPTTVVFTKNLFDEKELETMKYPLVLKQPDSAFSLGVHKVNDKTEAKVALHELFRKSDMVVCQEFLFSDFDWRIGILDNKPIFACKYYMSKGHWQIYNWESTETDKSGDFETLDIGEVPEAILQTAQKASALIGDGLYGVDLKMVDNKVYVVEVNDNPNIDAGVEDAFLKDKLYDMVIDSIVERIEIAKNIRRINFTDH